MKQLLASLALLLACASPAFGQERLGPIDEQNTSARLRRIIEADHAEMDRLTGNVTLRVDAAQGPMTIHGHWQKAVYLNASEWPCGISGQTHFLRANGMVAHTHVEGCAPVWAETTLTVFTMPYQVVLFHTQGRVSTFGGPFVSRAVWHHPNGQLIEQGSVQPWYAPPFPIVGDPNGLVVVPVDVTIDTKLSQSAVNSPDVNTSSHGWWQMEVMATVEVLSDTGDLLAREDAALTLPMFSVIDPTQPISDPWALPFFTARSGHNSQSYASWGGQHASGEMIPILAPISSAVSHAFGGWEYPSTEPAQTTIVTDLNLHAGVSGNTVAVQTGAVSPFVFDPVTLGPGTHKIAVWWERADHSHATLLVVTVTVGAAGPTEVCGDGIDNDGDGLIDEDCVQPNPCLVSPLVPIVSVSAPGHVVMWTGSISVQDERGCTAVVSQ